MGVLNEGRRAGEFLVSEANGTRSRAQVSILEDQVLQAGTVLGRITATGRYRALDPGASNGAQTPAGILWDDCDASDGHTPATAIVRDAEVRASSLVWPTSTEVVAGLATLATLGIIAR